MPDILHELTIAATPDVVYQAITEARGVTRWWAPEAIVQPKVGSKAECRFRGGQFVIPVEINRLEPGRNFDWAVKGGLPEWSGTYVRWNLTPVDNGTKVRFGHCDHASTDGLFANNSYTWPRYLTSLKDYVETGKGRPGQAPGTS
jgi:uncharacterized protein YndB with AHSA1/START domain